MFFRKNPKPPEGYPLARCIELLGEHAGPEARDRAIHKLYGATQTVMDQFRPHVPDDARFAEFKSSLRPDQAAMIADKTRELGRSIRKQAPPSNPDAFAVDDMAFMFVAATLHARAGAALDRRT